jgi:protein-disulfide isomerase
MRILASLLLLAQTLASATVEGNAQSPVRVVIFEDLQCGDCARLRAMLDNQLLPKFGATVAFEHRDFPLEKHAWARRAALAARYFDRQNPNVGIEFRRQALANLTLPDEEFTTWLIAFARQYAVDPVKTVAALKSPALAAQVDKDVEEGTARGVNRTPTVFVDGEPFVETFTFEALSQAITAALAAHRNPR